MKKIKAVFLKKSAALFLVLALLLAAVPASVFAAESEAPLSVAVISDVHYYAPENVDNIAVYEAMCRKSASASFLTPAILESGLATVTNAISSAENKILLIPGDLTKDGDQVSHRALAARLRQYEEKTGTQVYVTNGNHDVGNGSAASFANGKFVPSAVTTPEIFKEIYADFGFNQADDVFTPAEGKKAGMLSYGTELDGGYYLLVLDGGKYSTDNTKDGRTHETGGNYSDDLMTWALARIADARARGLEVIGMTHWNIVPHFECEDSLFVDFPIDNWQYVSEQFADAGMQTTFSGHIHCHDIACHVSDNGNKIYDCATSSVMAYPNYVRTVTFDNTRLDEGYDVSYKTYDCDEQLAVTSYSGFTYPKPYRMTSFGLNFTGTDPYNFVMNFAEYFLTDNYIPQIIDRGGLYNFLCEQFKLESVFDDLLNGGVKVIGINVFSTRNLLSLTKNLCDQIDKAYIENPEHLMDVIGGVIRKLLDVKISDIPCSKFVDTLGFGSKTRPGTFGDMASCCLAYFYTADEDASDDAFIQDVLTRFDSGEIAQDIFDTLIDIVLNDLLTNEIFANVRLKLSAAFPIGSFGAGLSRAIDGLLYIFLGGNNTLNGIIDFGFKVVSSLGIVDFTSIDDILNHYIDEYLTKSQMDTIAAEFARILSNFCIDENPALANDCNISFTVLRNSSAVEKSSDNLRLPSNVSVTFGEDSASSRNISWYTKLSVKGTDIQIIPYSATPVFDGSTVPTDVSINKKTETVRRTYPGVDLGIFGVINYYFNLIRHEISITGLQPGTKYSYRIGDASKGYWSDAAVIETADNSDSFTFFHMSDSQSGMERQYKVWANVVKQAYKLYPDSAFIMHTGDLSDSGNNFKQWKWLFNTAQSNLMNTVLMPAAGNHEAKGEYALDLNFILSNVPEQNTETGTYYSFEYNNAYFAVLNTNDLGDDDGISAKQLEWLKADAAASDAQWKFVALHKAPYSNGSHYDDNDVIAIREQLSTLMPQLGIDVVLQGHDHVYLRTDVLNNNKQTNVYEMAVTNNGKDYSAKVNPNGTIYVIDACSGVKYYLTKNPADTDKLFPRAEAIFDATLPVFGAFTIDGDTLYFDAYTVEGEKLTNIDSFAILKDASIETPKDNSLDIFGRFKWNVAA